MSSQRQDQSKPEKASEKKTDTTAMLSAEELKAISGGATAPPTKAGGGSAQPSSKGAG